jgi:hypothetical protein
MYRTPTHISWKSMLNRCLNPKADQYKQYGARGITVCERWRTFSNFLADMGERPAGMTLDRINPNGDYEPSNCRWASGKAQRRNSSQKVRYMTVNGETLCLQDWCKRLGLRENKVRYRLSQGWPEEKALSTERHNRSGRVIGT